MATTDANVFTIEQIAFLYQVEPAEVRRWVKEGKLRVSREGGRLCIRRADLLAFDPEALPPRGDPPIQPETTAEARVAVWKNYDPERARRAWASIQGLLMGVDRDELIADIYAQRGQDSKGRPGD